VADTGLGKFLIVTALGTKPGLACPVVEAVKEPLPALEELLSSSEEESPLS